MIALVRAGVIAALISLISISFSLPVSAQKAFGRDDLADAAIKLEAQIKAESGQITKNAATLRREADAAFARNAFRPGLQALGQIAVVAPADSANWLRLAKAVLQIRPANDGERTALLERSATAAYIAYLRSSDPAQDSESLLVVSRSFADRQLWRPALDAMRASLDIREVAAVRQHTNVCVKTTDSACSTIRWIPIPLRPAYAFSSPKIFRAGASTSRRL
jgi:alpha-2-macroglobulin